MSINFHNNEPPEVGDIIEVPWYGPSEVLNVEPSGSDCVKITWMPVEEPWRVPNPPGLDYFSLPRGYFRNGEWHSMSTGEKATSL